jgi:hypothetical protein
MSTILCHDETHGNIAEVTNPTPEQVQTLNNMGMEGYEEESAEAEAEADTFAAEGAAASGGSRMISRGKAAKIGITLLAILAIIAGVVVLSPKKSNEPPSAVSSSQQQAKVEPNAKATVIVSPVVSPTPAPKPQNKEKSEKKTKAPKPAPINTPFPTDEGTATVSTETTGPPTLQPRDSVRLLKGQGK